MEKVTLILAILAAIGTIVGVVRSFIKETKDAYEANKKLALYVIDAAKDGIDEKEQKKISELALSSAKETMEAYNEGLKLWNVIKKNFFKKK